MSNKNKEINQVLGDLFYVSGGYLLSQPRLLSYTLAGKSVEQFRTDFQAWQEKTETVLEKIRESYGEKK